MRRKLLHRVLITAAALLLILLTGVPVLYPKSELPPVMTKPIPGSSPLVCIGYNPLRARFGAEDTTCPKGYAFFGIDDPAGIKGPGKYIGTSGTCCPLPSDDILTEEHVYVSESCPEDYVATGGKNRWCGKECNKYMRCTRINTDRYQLGPMNPAVYWGDGAAGWSGSRVIAWHDIPAGIRYSMGRQTETDWDIDGCVGYPWGSLLAGKSSKYCSGLYFRQLQFKGLRSDPPRGTAVKMFPECSEVSNINDPERPVCTPYG